MIVMASHMQEQEVGDGTNFVLVFAGALLELAEELLRMGLSVSEVNSNIKHHPVCMMCLCNIISSVCKKVKVPIILCKLLLQRLSLFFTSGD